MMRLFLFLVFACLFSAPSFAKDTLDYDNFSRIPVQHEGRIKPFDSFARNYLKSFSGHESLKGLNADQWLAETLFNPAEALSRPTFRVFRPGLVGLTAREGNLYSFSELAGALRTKSPVLEKLAKTDPKNWSEDQKELIRLQENSILYTQLLRSFSLLLPLKIQPPAVLAKEWKLKTDTSFQTLQDFQKYDRRLSERLQGIINRKGDNPDRYSDAEKDIATFAYEMQALKQGGDFNVLLRVVPSSAGSNGEWFSPWALGQQGTGTPDTAAILTVWQRAAKAYLEQDAAAFDTASGELMRVSSTYKITLEILYNQYHPLGVAMILYLAAFLAFAGFSLLEKRGLYKLSAALLGTGLVLNAVAVLGRVLILSRPPVGTLYESLLFVSALCVAMALAIEWRRKDGAGLLTGSLIGLLLLFVSQAFTADDTMKVLVAVLNTNFWLGTHVLCITIGYGVCLIAGSFAHLYLLRRAFGKDTGNLLPSIRVLGLIALLFTAVGTILGGVWADQSWGRFWGWDPKENGALLIVLWLIWIYHGQLSGHLKTLPFMALMAAVNIVVALAWFGVNLLNVGLHSYGFISGVAASLAAFCSVEILTIAFLWHKGRSAA